nr:MAG TPA: hypothetical protein [Caudoviricetes sp.]
MSGENKRDVYWTFSVVLYSIFGAGRGISPSGQVLPHLKISHKAVILETEKRRYRQTVSPSLCYKK